MAGTEKRRSTEPRNTDTMGVPATADSTFEWREEGAHVSASPRRRRRFRCRAKVCAAEFSVTSGTILASRKLSFKTLLLALALSVHSVKGKAACELKRELGVGLQDRLRPAA